MRNGLSPWLARLSYSFFILAGLLMYESHRAIHGQLGPVGSGRIVLFWVGALVSFVLGCVGVRERHRPQNPHDPQD
jgi:peptidoglycan/LPS O-acetylase OafA/YrhL